MGANSAEMVLSISSLISSRNSYGISIPTLNVLLIGVLFFGKILDDSLVYYLSYAVVIVGIIQFFFLYIIVKKFYLPKIKKEF